MDKISQRPSRLPPSFVMYLQISPLITRIIVILVVTFVTLGLMSHFKESLHVLETRLANITWTLNSDAEPESRITIVAIDEKSIAQMGPWPWSREILAELSKVLAEAGVKSQLYDIVFPEEKAGDDIFINTLEKTDSIIAQIPIMVGDQQLQTGLMNQNITGMRCQQPIPSTKNYLANHHRFKNIAKGHITPVVDPDGSINTLAPLICVEGQVYPTLALTGLLRAAGIPQPTIKLEKGKGLLAAPWIVSIEQYPELTIPLDSSGNMRVSYRKSPDSFQVISAVDILNKTVDPYLLKNTFAQIGATAFGLGDIVPTPYSGVTPGIELQARLMTSLLDNDLPYTPQNSVLLQILLSSIFAFILYVLCVSSNRITTFSLPLVSLLFPFCAWLSHALLLTHYNIWLGWIAPAVFSLLAGILLSLLEHNRSRLEQTRVYNNFDSYLPPNTATKIAYNLPSSEISVDKCDVTLLSADLRNFSAFVETNSAESSVALLHNFFVKSCSVIEEQGGSVHEFKGDALLAVWPEEEVEKALRAALQLHKKIPELWGTNVLADSLALGIGIEQGTVLSGSLGPANRRTHTMLGDTVTKTLRIQEMTSDLAQPILLGPKAARFLPKNTLESQGEYLLSGLQKPHTLFAPFIGTIDGQKNNKNTTSLKLLYGGK
jgi:CHASE2 domain-containing sensor protein/class 3 adenylate cyclase